jgi:hypothetical protein
MIRSPGKQSAPGADRHSSRVRFAYPGYGYGRHAVGRDVLRHGKSRRGVGPIRLLCIIRVSGARGHPFLMIFCIAA